MLYDKDRGENNFPVWRFARVAKDAKVISFMVLSVGISWT
jgi:hypothetical protein